MDEEPWSLSGFDSEHVLKSIEVVCWPSMRGRASIQNGTRLRAGQRSKKVVRIFSATSTT